MEAFSYKPTNKLYRPGVDLDRSLITEQLEWFTTEAAANVAKSASGIPGVEHLFGFARTMALGYGFVDTSGQVVRFVGWQIKLMVKLAAGTVLLDATADIDGVSQVVTWREHVEVPKPRYDNLDIIHVPQHTNTQLTKYFKTVANRRAYTAWMTQP
jgi:hypothetical protein